jgi:integrase
MGRKRTYWLRASDGCYYATHNGKKVKLGKAGTPLPVIEARFNELVALSAQPDQLTVRALATLFLTHCEEHNATTTHGWYRDFLDPFAAHVKPGLLVAKLTPSTVSKWIDGKYGDSAPSTRHGAARAVVRMVNWAVKERLIPSSPLVGFVKPAASSREALLTPAQYRQTLRAAKNGSRDVVEFLYETGCRPQEFRAIEIGWWEDNRIVFPVAKSKGKKKRRVIYLNPVALEIVKRYAADFIDGVLFRNSDDKPWTKNSLNCVFRRLKKKTEIDSLCAYSLRHTRITELLKSGVDVATVAALMGNSPRMILEVYQHVARDENHLMNSLNGTKPSNGTLNGS